MKKLTKLISILLAVLILCSVTAISAGSVNSNTSVITATNTAVTGSNTLYFNKGDVVTYCLELTVPANLTDISGWYLDIIYDRNILEVDKTFANGCGYACGDKAVDYATGLSSTKATLPGGTSTIANFNNNGAISICDMGPNGLKLLGKTTKLLCLRFKAIEKGSCTLSYRVKEILNFTALDSYVDNNYKLKNGITITANIDVDRAAILGDINGDYTMSKSDLTSFMSIYAKKSTASADEIAVCDLDESGDIGLADLMMLTKIIADY